MKLNYNTTSEVGRIDISGGSGLVFLDKEQMKTLIDLLAQFLYDYEGWRPKIRENHR